MKKRMGGEQFKIAIENMSEKELIETYLATNIDSNIVNRYFEIVYLKNQVLLMPLFLADERTCSHKKSSFFESAIRFNNPTMVKVFLADANLTDKTLHNHFMIAASVCQREVLELFLADSRLNNEQRESAFYVAMHADGPKSRKRMTLSLFLADSQISQTIKDQYMKEYIKEIDPQGLLYRLFPASSLLLSDKIRTQEESTLVSNRFPN